MHISLNVKVYGTYSNNCPLNVKCRCTLFQTMLHLKLSSLKKLVYFILHTSTFSMSLSFITDNKFHSWPVSIKTKSAQQVA
jgi:hypothetical protein